MRTVIGLFLFFMVLLGAVPANAATVTWTNGWLWPANRAAAVNRGWLASAGSRGYHLGYDIDNRTGEPVYSIADGEVIVSRTDVDGYGPNDRKGGALLVRYPTSEGQWFLALYGHLDSPHAPGRVARGEILGYTNAQNHLHFGIRPEYSPTGNAYLGYTKSKGDVGGFMDPFNFFTYFHPRVEAAPKLVAPSVVVYPSYERGGGYLNASWSSPKGATGYDIELQYVNPVRAAYTVWTASNVAWTSARFNVGRSAMKWQVRVRAKSASAVGPWSAWASAYVT